MTQRFARPRSHPSPGGPGRRAGWWGDVHDTERQQPPFPRTWPQQRNEHRCHRRGRPSKHGTTLAGHELPHRRVRRLPHASPGAGACARGRRPHRVHHRGWWICRGGRVIFIPRTERTSSYRADMSSCRHHHHHHHHPDSWRHYRWPGTLNLQDISSAKAKSSPSASTKHCLPSSAQLM
jgi:hypothetical protein